MTNKKQGNAAGVTRRAFLRTTVASATAGTLFNIGRARAETRGRVVMLGYDGMEPSVTDAMLGRGELPNLARLREQGGYHRLTSTIPPQSPVAWNSFSTCRNPGGHNIFDFIRRNPQGAHGPMPLVGTGRLTPPVIAPDGALQEPAQAETFRKGTPFWSVVDEHGKRSKVLNIPFAYPPDPMKHGLMLCALGVPDLRGTTSTYFALSDAFTKAELSEELGGGRRIPLEFSGEDDALFPIPGPRDNRYRFNESGAYTETLLRIRVNRRDSRGVVEVDGARVELEAGHWSDWLELEFVMSDRVRVRGITRFFPSLIGDVVRIYMACVQYHPEAPYTSLSTPADYSAALKERHGLYKTIGWAYDTHALRQHDLEEDAFLQDVEYTMSWRDQLTLDELDRGNFDMLLSAWTATDRVGHMFWRFRDEQHASFVEEAPQSWKTALEHTYRRADALTGRVLERLRDEDTLFVFSDHGFGTWRRAFNLNTWLRDEGYLTVDNPQRADSGFLQGIDWTQTRAYAVGLSSLYLNVKGRESLGVVAQEETEALKSELREKLSHVRDPKTGAPVFSNLYSGVYHGEAIDEASDISLGYAQGYQNTRQASRGGVGGPLFEEVDDKWSGEHAATDYQLSAGVLFSNRPIEKGQPHIQDLGVTALNLLGCETPRDYEGEALV